MEKANGRSQYAYQKFCFVSLSFSFRISDFEAF